MLHYHFLPLTLYGQVFVHLHVWACPKHNAHYQANAYLSHYFVASLQSLLVVMEDLDEIVHSAQEAKPYRSDNHQDEIDVAHTSQQQYRHKYGKNNDDTAHGWHTNLLYAKRIYRGISLGFSNLLALQVFDEFLAEPSRDDK